MSAPTPIVRPRDLATAAARSVHAQALLTAERMQGPGFLFAMLPVLRRIDPPGPGRMEALARHASYFATHPILMGYVVGVAARLETQRAAGAGGDPRAIDQTKRALGSALAAVGDPLFWVTARPLAGLIGILVIFALPPPHEGGPDWRVLLGPLALLLTYNAIALPFRVFGVERGFALAAEPASIIRSLGAQEVRIVIERAAALAFGAWITIAVAQLRPFSQAWGDGLGERAVAFAPIALGALITWIGQARRPGASVETAAAALLGGLALAVAA